MQTVKSFLKNQPVLSLGFLLLIVYVVLRAALVNITHDEAYSFHNVKNFWISEFLCTGNSHWINSAAMKLSLLSGCESVFCLRWFSVFSFILTCCFGWWWLKTFSSTSIKLLGFCVLFLNPYLLDYFGLARGYAAGIMFQCLALWFFVKGINKNKRLTLFLSIAFAGLSSISNYSFVYFLFAFALIYFYTVYFKGLNGFYKRKSFYVDALICLGTFLLIGRAILFMIRCSGDFKGAGEPSFLAMFHVLSDGFFYHKLVLPKLIQFGISLGIFFCISLSCYFGIFKRKEHQNALYYYSSLIFPLMILPMILNYLCFHAPYPFYRAAQLLIVPSAVSFVSFIRFKFIFYKPVILVFSFLLIINFMMSINLKHAFDFMEQTDSKESFDELQKLNAKHVGISPELYGVFVNYYYTSNTKKYNYIGDRIETYYPKGICPVENKLAEFDYLVLYPPYDLTYYKNSDVHLTYVSVSPNTKNLIVRVQKKPRSNNTPGLHKP